MHYIFNPERIRKIRTAKNLSTAAVAQMLGKRRQQYKQWEDGSRTPSSKNLGLIAGILEVSPDIFYELSHDIDCKQ